MRGGKRPQAHGRLTASAAVYRVYIQGVCVGVQWQQPSYIMLLQPTHTYIYSYNLAEIYMGDASE